MAEKKDKAGEVLQSRKNELTVVAQDRNWRSYVNNELRCADQWHADWGFLGANSDGKWLCPHVCAVTDRFMCRSPGENRDHEGGENLRALGRDGVAERQDHDDFEPELRPVAPRPAGGVHQRHLQHPQEPRPHALP